MKNRYFIAGLLCLIIRFQSLGQGDNPKDTVALKVGDRLNLIIEIVDYDLLKNKFDVTQLIQDFQNDFRQVSANIPTQSPFVIKYKQKSLLEFEEKQAVNKFIVENGQTKPVLLRNQSMLSMPGVLLTIDFEAPDDLLNPALPQAVKKMVDQLPVRQRFLKVLKFEANDFASDPVLKDDFNNLTSIDMLSLGAGVGANVIYNRFFTDVRAELALQLSKKGILRNQFYVSNNLLFDFDPERKIVVNNFSNIGYRRNLSRNSEKADWLGLEFGMLTSRRGELFPRNTFKFGVSWDAGKHISVTPTLYFNGFFKQVSPGIRIGFGI